MKTKHVAKVMMGWLMVSAASAEAALLSEAKYFKYDLRFTNPVCGPHAYAAPIKNAKGDKDLVAKPKDVYCSGKQDNVNSGSREDSVQQSILKWVNDPSTKEIFFAALSFSNTAFHKAMCRAAERGVKITYVLDRQNSGNGGGSQSEKPLTQCGPNVRFVPRGHAKIDDGSNDGIKWAHNKIIIINPNDPEKLSIAFGSGNFSSGMVTHHENWHFITADRNTYFMQTHLCLMNGLLSEQASSSRSAYTNYIKSCQAKAVAQGMEPETDVQVFLSPGQGQAATRAIEREVAKSQQVLVAAHRFSYSRLVRALERRLTDKTMKRPDIRLVCDDDMYWLTQPADMGGGQLGDNSEMEAERLQKLMGLGGGKYFKVKYMETNHDAHQLHHNKFLIFDKRAVFTGAGNLTGDAFDNNPDAGNFENFYLIKIPAKVTEFRNQYNRFWNGEKNEQGEIAGAATAPENMPSRNELPQAN